LRPLGQYKLSDDAARVIQLEQQLETMRADLQVAIRDLEIANHEHITSALLRARTTAAVSHACETASLRFAALTTREQQILNLVLAGHPSKNIAADLGISQRTVENHRAAIMRKSSSKSVAALVRTALAAGWVD
jgi:FixJ family two-component response regulator